MILVLGVLLGVILGVAVFVRLRSRRERMAVGRNQIASAERLALDLKKRERIMLSLMEDLQASREELKKKSDELERSNAELQQFAYIASHDLQEPLRQMVNSSDFLKRNLKEQLDDTNRKFMHYITDGATRMQELISSLLTYSRVGRAEIMLKPTDMNGIVTKVLQSLDVAIRENGAAVTCGPLPTLSVEPVLMTQLLQNLVGNAIKYHGSHDPRVYVSAKRENEHWRFAVKDNGIGIEPQYFERIFVVFQRLHTRQEYSGTGIGLAICKKIVERHGGRIWVESAPGEGTTFYFTLPAGQA